MADDLRQKSTDAMGAAIKLLVGTHTSSEFDAGFKKILGFLEQFARNTSESIKQMQRQVDDLSRKLQRDRQADVADLKKRSDAALKEAQNSHSRKIDAIYRHHLSMTQGPKGDKGEKGDTGDRGMPGRDGKDGRPGRDGSPDSALEIKAKLESLAGSKRLNISAIAGFDEMMRKMQPRQSAAGPSRGMFLYVGGVKKGLISNLNLVGSSGVSLAYSKEQGQDTITITASGAGVSVETPTGSVDSSNTTFTPSAEPKWIVVDGTTYYEGAGYTWDGTTITTDVAPSSFIRAII
jgi:hypothetical protein